MDQTDIAIIGAGPHGLAAAAHLRRAGVECRIIGEPMSFWRTMPKGMLLRSNWTATCIAEYDGPLSLDSYSAATDKSLHKPFPLQDFLDYGGWVANQVAPDVDRRRVVRVDREADAFLLSFDAGEPLRARRVVVAAGIADFPRRPEVGADLPPSLVSHSADHSDFSDWKSSRVLVVGGGQSALESAALLHEAGAEVSVAVRAPLVHWLHGGKYHRMLGRMAPLVYAPTDVGPMGLSRVVAVPKLFRRFPRSLQDPMAARAIRPAGAAWLKPRLEMIPLHFGRTVREMHRENSHVSVTFDTGRTQSFDHVLFGTGYRIDISRYGFLPPDLLRQLRCVDGYPVLGKGMESAVPGLHFMGATAAYSWGPIMRFVAGGWFGAESLTGAVTGKRVTGSSTASPKFNAAARVRESSRGSEMRRRGSAPHSTDVGAVVLGGDYQGLGIARSLGRRGVPICVLDDEHSIASASRYVGHRLHVADLRTADTTVDALIRAADTMGLDGWVVYPTRDEMVAAIAGSRDRLAKRFRIPTPGWESVSAVWDKRETYRLAAELGIATPRTWLPQDEGDLSQIPLDAPLVIKPAVKEKFFYATGAKAWRADDAATLRELYRRAAAIVPPGEVMIQELVPGGGDTQYAYCALFKDGVAVADMTVRRRRQHPSDFGRSSTYVETVDLPLLAEPSARFLKAIEFYGLVELEYKHDRRDGEWKLLDVNARTWGYHTLGRAAGVDFPYLLYRDQLGLSVPRLRARPGVRWIRVVTDMPNAVRDMAAGDIKLRDYLRTLSDVDTEAVFSWRDPLPGLYELALLPYLAAKRGL